MDLKHFLFNHFWFWKLFFHIDQMRILLLLLTVFLYFFLFHYLFTISFGTPNIFSNPVWSTSSLSTSSVIYFLITVSTAMMMTIIVKLIFSISFFQRFYSYSTLPPSTLKTIFLMSFFLSSTTIFFFFYCNFSKFLYYSFSNQNYLQHKNVFYKYLLLLVR